MKQLQEYASEVSIRIGESSGGCEQSRRWPPRVNRPGQGNDVSSRSLPAVARAASVNGFKVEPGGSRMLPEKGLLLAATMRRLRISRSNAHPSPGLRKRSRFPPVWETSVEAEPSSSEIA